MTELALTQIIATIFYVGFGFALTAFLGKPHLSFILLEA